MKEIDDRLQEHYHSLQLDKNVLNTITASGARTTNRLPKRPLLKSPVIHYAAAAMVLLAITLGTHRVGVSSERALRTVNEAAMNHSVKLQFEFEADNINDINSQMSELKFQMALPSDLDEKLNVLGARYCTINGELAAHIKFLNLETNRTVSLFMTQSAKSVQTINTTTDNVNGVAVKLWNESGLFYAMAH